MVIINGLVSDEIAVTDRGLNYGDGLFETMLSNNQQIPLLERHLQRLKLGCATLAIAFPDEAQIRAEISTLLNNSNTALGTVIVKLIITRGSGGRGFSPSDEPTSNRVLMSLPYPSDYCGFKNEGIRTHVCQTRLSSNPQLAGLKHLNRLEQVLASKERQHTSYDEGIMLDYDGFVIEGTRSNLFLISENALITAELSSSGVAGVFRQTVMDSCHKLGIQVDVRRIQEEMLKQCDGLFMTNAISGILPVVEHEQRALSIHPLVAILNKQLPF